MILDSLMESLENLPVQLRELKYTYLLKKPVIYTGIARRPTSSLKSLREGDYKNDEIKLSLWMMNRATLDLDCEKHYCEWSLN